MDLGLLLLRLVVGGLFIGHGTQKLFGWFGGHGPQGTGGFFASLGYRPGVQMAVLAGLTEAGGGALLVLGFLTPLAAAMIIGVMVNATLAVHVDKGLWNSNGGFELPLVFSAAAAALAFVGPGSWSIDQAIGPFDGYAYGFGAIGLGVITGLIVHSMRQRRATAEERPAERRRAA